MSLLVSDERKVFSLDFWSEPQEEVLVDTGADTLALPDVTVGDLPAGARVVRAVALFKWRMTENDNAAINSLDGATVAGVSQVIQVRSDAPGTWRDAINFVDDQFSVAATAKESGDAIIGSLDIAVEVTANDTYNFRWLLSLANEDSLMFNDVQVGLRVYYTT